MRLFWELSKLSFKRQLAYRTANLAGLATNFFFGLLRAAVLVALYGDRREVEGISLAGVVAYTGLTQAMIGFLSLFGWYEAMNSIYTGEIASDLLKPLNFYTFWLARDMGRAAASFLMRSLTMMTAYLLFFHIPLPQSLAQWLGLAVALPLSWLVCFSWHFLVNLAAFWSPDARGIGRNAFGLIWFLSGFFLPLRFFPDWFIRLCHMTPFPSMVNTVVEVYLGVLRGADLLGALALQMFWAVVLFLLIQGTIRAGIRRLVIQGG